MTSQADERLIHSSRIFPCPVCEKDHGCKISDNLILCLRGDRDVGLCEGTSKPLIASYRLNKTFIGASGGNFASSPQLLKRYLASVKPERVIISWDGGWKTNPHVRRQNEATARLIAEWGYKVYFEDWGQAEDKESPDIDEIWPEAKTHLVASQKEFSDRGSRVISKERWDEKFGIPRKFEKFADLLANRVKKFTQKTGFGKPEPESPIIPVNANLSSSANILTYVPGELPDVLEWAELGCPRIRVKNGDDIEFAREAIALGYQEKQV